MMSRGRGNCNQDILQEKVSIFYKSRKKNIWPYLKDHFCSIDTCCLAWGVKQNSETLSLLSKKGCYDFKYCPQMV